MTRDKKYTLKITWFREKYLPIEIYEIFEAILGDCIDDLIKLEYFDDYIVVEVTSLLAALRIKDAVRFEKRVRRYEKNHKKFKEKYCRNAFEACVFYCRKSIHLKSRVLHYP